MDREIWNNHERTAKIYEAQPRRKWVGSAQRNCPGEGERTIQPCIADHSAIYLSIQLSISMLFKYGIGLNTKAWKIRMGACNAKRPAGIFSNRNNDSSRIE